MKHIHTLMWRREHLQKGEVVLLKDGKHYRVIREMGVGTYEIERVYWWSRLWQRTAT